MTPSPNRTAPSATAFRIPVPVRITDINYGNHLGNDALVGLLHEARVRYLAARGASERGGDGQAGLILRELQVRFLRQIRYGDPVEMEVRPADIRGASFTLLYRVWVGGEVAAEARTDMAGFDYTRDRPTRLPPALRERLRADAPAEL